MKRKNPSPVGALHPVLFFAGVYIVSLFFSIFICSSVFYSCNSTAGNEPNAKAEKPVQINSNNTAVASIK
jgi:hypothetical protein